MITLTETKKRRQYTDRSAAREVLNNFINSKPNGFVFKMADACELYKKDATLKNIGNIHALLYSFLNNNKNVKRLSRGYYQVVINESKEEPKAEQVELKLEAKVLSNIPKVKQLIGIEITKSIYMNGEEYYIESFVLAVEGKMGRKLTSAETGAVKDFLDNSGNFALTDEGGYIYRHRNKQVIADVTNVPTQSPQVQEVQAQASDDDEDVSEEVYTIFLNGYLNSTQLEVGTKLDPEFIYNGLIKYLKVYPNNGTGIKITEEVFMFHKDILKIQNNYYYKKAPMAVNLKFQ